MASISVFPTAGSTHGGALSDHSLLGTTQNINVFAGTFTIITARYDCQAKALEPKKIAISQ